MQTSNRMPIEIRTKHSPARHTTFASPSPTTRRCKTPHLIFDALSSSNPAHLSHPSPTQSPGSRPPRATPLAPTPSFHPMPHRRAHRIPDAKLIETPLTSSRPALLHPHTTRQTSNLLLCRPGSKLPAQLPAIHLASRHAPILIRTTAVSTKQQDQSEKPPEVCQTPSMRDEKQNCRAPPSQRTPSNPVLSPMHNDRNDSGLISSSIRVPSPGQQETES